MFGGLVVLSASILICSGCVLLVVDWVGLGCDLLVGCLLVDFAVLWVEFGFDVLVWFLG